MIIVELLETPYYGCMELDCDKKGSISIRDSEDCVMCPEHARELAESLMKITSKESNPNAD